MGSDSSRSIALGTWNWNHNLEPVKIICFVDFYILKQAIILILNHSPPPPLELLHPISTSHSTITITITIDRSLSLSPILASSYEP